MLQYVFTIKANFHFKFEMKMQNIGNVSVFRELTAFNIVSVVLCKDLD